MSGEMEAAGALATAGIVAGALDGREAGGHGDGACLNCGAQLTGPYCSQCGQHGHPHRKLTHVFEEFLHGILHFDTKAWRTLPMVVFRPGTLTRNFVYGKRARYISPLALFLFTIFLMFFVFAFAMPPVNLNAPVPTPSQETAQDLTEAREELAQAQRELADVQAHPDPDQPAGLEARLAQTAVNVAQAQVDRLERQLAENQAEEAAEGTPGATVSAGAPQAGVSVHVGPDAPPATTTAAPASPAPEAHASGQRTWADELREAARRDDFVVIGGMPELNERIRHKFENPELALYKIQQAAYKFSFLLAPLSLPFIALLFFWKRGVTLYDHMAYALYALSFAAILFIALVLTSQQPWLGWVNDLLYLALPIHTFFHLKGAYALGWFSALWRTFFMLTFAFIIAIIFVLLIVVLGLAG